MKNTVVNTLSIHWLLWIKTINTINKNFNKYIKPFGKIIKIDKLLTTENCTTNCDHCDQFKRCSIHWVFKILWGSTCISESFRLCGEPDLQLKGRERWRWRRRRVCPECSDTDTASPTPELLLLRRLDPAESDRLASMLYQCCCQKQILWWPNLPLLPILPSNQRTSSRQCAAYLSLAPPGWQTLSTFQIQKSSSPDFCNGQGLWWSSQSMAKDEE